MITTPELLDSLAWHARALRSEAYGVDSTPVARAACAAHLARIGTVLQRWNGTVVGLCLILGHEIASEHRICSGTCLEARRASFIKNHLADMPPMMVKGLRAELLEVTYHEA